MSTNALQSRVNTEETALTKYMITAATVYLDMWARIVPVSFDNVDHI